MLPGLKKTTQAVCSITHGQIPKANTSLDTDLTGISILLLLQYMKVDSKMGEPQLTSWCRKLSFG